jgi:Ca2+-transporting ATPase
MDTFASIALCSEPPRPGLMGVPPKRRDDNILTPSMLTTIFSTAAFFVVVMMGLLLGLEAGWFAGTGEKSAEFTGLTVRQISIFFTVYVLFQVWNEINSRTLVPEVSGLRGVLHNPTFLTIVGLIVVVQVLIITFGGAVFYVEPLGVLDWLVIAVGTASVLVFAEAARLVRLRLKHA